MSRIDVSADSGIVTGGREKESGWGRLWRVGVFGGLDDACPVSSSLHKYHRGKVPLGQSAVKFGGACGSSI